MKNNVIKEVLNLHNKLFLDKKNYEQIEGIFLNEKFFVKYILEKNEFIGYIIVYDSFDSYELFEIAVDENFQNKRYGLNLLEFIPNDKDVFLEVSINNTRAYNIYLKYGFEKISIRKNYYKDGSDAIIMKKSKERKV